MFSLNMTISLIINDSFGNYRDDEGYFVVKKCHMNEIM